MTASRQWIVDEKSPKGLKDVLESMNVDEAALSDGRVFVARLRVSDAALRLKQGDMVEVYAPAPRTVVHGEARILEIRQGIVAAFKPAGMPTVADHSGVTRSLQAFVAQHVKAKKVKDVHATSRLDVGVSGVVLFATTAAAREMLQAARDRGAYQRHYVALASTAPNPPIGVAEEAIGKAADPRLRMVGGASPAESRTRYETIARSPRGALLSVEPITGRTHQIRVHMAHHGAPLLGDVAYGGVSSFVMPSGSVKAIDRIALHASWVMVERRSRGRLWLLLLLKCQPCGWLWAACRRRGKRRSSH
jgi:23S rRNA-/tRNA-specific pseudouridylate synthase